MSNDPVRVAVRWLSSEEGGRHRPFIGAKYRPTAVLDGGDGQIWSAVIDFDDASEPSAGRFRFLAATAPGDLLMPDAQLKLYEGPRVVAECRVTADVQVAAVAGSTR